MQPRKFEPTLRDFRLTKSKTVHYSQGIFLSLYGQPSFYQCSVIIIIVIIIIIITFIVIADLLLPIAGINRVWKFFVLIGADFVIGH
jgi:hypothetical protein